VRKEPVAAAPTRLRSWASLPQRALDVWRIEGLRSVAWRMLAATVYRRLVVLERPFPGFDAHAGRAASVTIERVGDEALGDYLRLRPDERRAAVERRFASGEHCFLAYDRGRVVGAAWVTARRTFVDYLDWEVKLAPGALCVHDLYVVPDWRGRGLGRALMEGSMELARQRGAVYMDLGTNEDDVAARNLYESLGFSNREGRPDGPTMYYYEREL
jgi:GNAT superfamily N-acetyltransferase